MKKFKISVKSLYCFSISVFLFFTVAFNQTVIAQQRGTRTITGTVIDASGSFTLPGASLVIKNTQKGTVTDSDGNFSISASRGDTLVFSFMGYQTSEIIIEDQTTLKVEMTESRQTLNEVVVIGYGSTLKKEVTGAISSVREDEFNKGVYSDALGLIQGKVAGLSIRKPGGSDPQAGYEIILRGTNTLTSGQGPLIIIDGVAGADIKNINFSEVESVDVLKDGSAAAIYGTRGTNGVIIITTKRAKSGETKIEYSSLFTGEVAPRGVRTLTAGEFRHAIETYTPDKLGNIYEANTDWFGEVTRELPVSQRHNLSMTGGGETFYHRTSLNIDRGVGLQKDNENNRYLFRTNIIQKAFDNKFEIDFNLTAGLRQYTPANTNVFYQAFIQNPTQPVYDDSNDTHGGYSSLPGIEYYNPVALLNEQRRTGKTNDIAPNVKATIRLFDFLSFVNFASVIKSSWEGYNYRTQFYPSRIGSNGEAEVTGGSSQNLQYESTLNYNQSFNAHNIQAVAGYAFQESDYTSNYMGNSNFDTDFYGPYNIGSGAALQNGTAYMGSYRESSRLISFFGRVMYNYSGKYLLSMSLRREGSSKFGINNKWGSFPAVSLGWRMTEEDFMQNMDWLNDLKLRVGYGVTGNQDFASYKSLILMGRAGRFFYNGEWINSYQPASNPNPDLRWEKKKEFNAGFDFSVLQNRVTGSLDYYYRMSEDLLYTYDVAVPPYLFNKLFTNVGTISNTGLELSFNTVTIKKAKFQWNNLLTFSTNKNKLVKFSNEEFTNKYIDIGWIGGAIPLNSQRIEEGKSLGTFHGPVWLGLTDDGYDRFKNANPIGRVDPEDWESMGQAYPLLTIGFGNSFIYGNWDLNFNIRSQIGGNVLNLYRLYYENWQNIGARNIVYSQLENPEFIGPATYSSKYVEDATFLKLDNISINYNVPFKIQYVSDIRLSLNAQDVLLLTSYQGLDPEVRLSGLSPGIDPLTYYPRTTSITIGLNVTF
jgi:TonB-dependent starch-binding outer membrane protein SusC